MDTTKIENTFNRFLDETMALNDLPGIAAGLSFGYQDSPPHREEIDPNSARKDFRITSARGYADYVAKIPLHENHIFHCASVSKLFTSSAIMKLVESGTLGLYDRLCHLLPRLNFRGNRTRESSQMFREIRLWNLLTHTSGLGDVFDYNWDTAEYDRASLDRYIYESPEVIDQPMLWWPRSAPEFYGVPETDTNGDILTDAKGIPASLFRYSNIAYEILGQIISECSGMPYEDFIMRYLLRPAGMDISTMKTYEHDGWQSETANIKSPCIALPHEKDEDRSIRLAAHYPYTRQHAPSSTLTSNVSDLLKWGQANIRSSSGHNEVLLHKETYDSVWRKYTTVPNNGEKMGLGWFIRRQKIRFQNKSNRNISHEYILYGHEGIDDGFRSSFWICPELGLTTVLLSNISSAPLKRIHKKLFDCIVEFL